MQEFRRELLGVQERAFRSVGESFRSVGEGFRSVGEGFRSVGV